MKQRISMRRKLAIMMAALVPSGVSGFGGIESAAFMQDLATNSASLVHHASSSLTIANDFGASTSASLTLAAKDLLGSYKQCLISNPLATKMLTGGTLAVVGDAIAQSRIEDEQYDRRRALSFAAFDMCYRALQHALFPLIVANCHGQFLSSFGPLVQVLTHQDPTSFLAAMEQTLASQLGIVPFLYYPVFFSLTGFVQGLTQEQTVARAKDTFLPLMQRNLLFWIPVQFIQFGFIEESLQIPFLSACGLGWTFILSVMAGSTKQYSNPQEAAVEDNISTKLEEYEDPNVHYCVTGTEPGCEIDPDHLFPHVPFLEDDMEQLGHATQIVEVNTNGNEKKIEVKEEEKDLVLR